jgi:hypothetical protein
MRVLAFGLALCASFAHADLYRWVDRETGNVKFSNSPPPWFGDAEKQRTSPPVEVIRFGGPAAAKPAPAKPEPPAIADGLRRGPAAQLEKPPAQ